MDTGTIITIIVGCIGIGISLFFNIRFRKQIKRFEEGTQLSWPMVDSAIRDIKRMMDGENFQPDVIVALNFGGLIFAGILNCLYDPRKPVYTYYSARPQEDEGLPDFKKHLNEIEGNVLIVDSITIHGDSLQEAHDTLTNIKDIKSAVIAHSALVAKIKPDYLFREFTGYVYFPWGRAPRK